MAQVTPIKGFTNTPVTRSICILSIVVTLAVLILEIKPYFQLSIDPFVVQYSQYWRVVTFQLSVVNESDFLLSTILWFHFKTLERFLGPKKYLSLIALFALYNAVVTLMVLSLGQLFIVLSWGGLRYIITGTSTEKHYFQTVFNAATPGPLGIVSLLYVCYAKYIPVTYKFKLLVQKPKEDDSSDLDLSLTGNSSSENSSGAGVEALRKKLWFDVTLTSHFQIQILFTIFLLNHGFASILPCLVGLVIGKLYCLDLLIGSKTWALPKFIFQLFVSPKSAQKNVTASISRRFRGYEPVAGFDLSQSQTIVDDLVPNEEVEDDREMAIDDLRNQDEDAAAHSATPVRPLGRQFLDTFRA